MTPKEAMAAYLEIEPDEEFDIHNSGFNPHHLDDVGAVIDCDGEETHFKITYIRRNIIRKPWVPKKGETYWFATLAGTNTAATCTFANDYIDNRYIKNCNYFRTKEEAQAAAEKIKELLKELHK